MPAPASKLYAQNIVSILTLMTATGDDVEPGTFAPDFDDEIVSSSCVTRDGRILHEPTRSVVEPDSVVEPETSVVEPVETTPEGDPRE
jgi:NAD(P) transhydrogenase subunit alpha